MTRIRLPSPRLEHFLVAACLIAIAGCRDQHPNTAPSVAAQSQAATSEPVVLDPTVIVDVYPMVAPLTPEAVEFAAQASKNTDYADQQICAFLGMDPALDASRPEGLGCPRHENAGAN